MKQDERCTLCYARPPSTDDPCEQFGCPYRQQQEQAEKENMREPQGER